MAERTSELAAEKQKTEDLVCRMLPKAIALQLTRGETVAAETFECVTIYFRYVHLLPKPLQPFSHVVSNSVTLWGSQVLLEPALLCKWWTFSMTSTPVLMPLSTTLMCTRWRPLEMPVRPPTLTQNHCTLTSKLNCYRYGCVWSASS